MSRLAVTKPLAHQIEAGQRRRKEIDDKLRQLREPQPLRIVAGHDEMTVALNDANRLGHVMSGWSYMDSEQRYFAYCCTCDDYLYARPGKVYGEAKITGPAVSVRCPGK